MTMLILLLIIPSFRNAFNFGPMRTRDWLVASVAGCVGVSWFELYKARTHR
jgi:hypothetical protein